MGKEQATKEKIRKFLEKTADFVFLRQKDQGGFGLTPQLPPTLEDTFHALGILEILARFVELGERFKANAHRDFLLSKAKSVSQMSPKGLFHLVFSLKKIGQLSVAKGILSKKISPKGLEDTFYVLSAINELHLTVNENVQNMAAFPFGGIIKHRYMSLFIDRNYGFNTISQKSALEWIRSCKNSDGGYGFLPGSTSYIENTYWAICSYNLLGEEVLDKESVFCYIYGCRTKGGGFARKSGAAPFLDATFHAVSCIELMGLGEQL